MHGSHDLHELEEEEEEGEGEVRNFLKENWDQPTPPPPAASSCQTQVHSGYSGLFTSIEISHSTRDTRYNRKTKRESEKTFEGNEKVNLFYPTLVEARESE